MLSQGLAPYTCAEAAATRASPVHQKRRSQAVWSEAQITQMAVSGTGTYGKPPKFTRLLNLLVHVACVLSHPGYAVKVSPALGIKGSGELKKNVRPKYCLTALVSPAFSPERKHDLAVVVVAVRLGRN